MDDEEYGEPFSPADFQACASCGRTFVPETLVKHERICLKSTNKKRKVFNSAKQRADGTDINTVSKKTPSKPPPSKSKSNWRAKHEEFISTMRAAKEVTHAINTGAALPPPPKPTFNPDYVECPSCARRFNSTAAERHIPWCKEKEKRIAHKRPAAKKENVAIRTKYKPPLPSGQKGSASGQKGSASGRKGSPSGQKGSPSGTRTGTGMKGSKSSHEVAALYNGIDNMQISRKPVSMNGVNLRKRSSSLDRKKPLPIEPVNQRRSNSGDSRLRCDDEDEEDGLDYRNMNSYSYRRNSVGQRLSSADSSSSLKYPLSNASTLPAIAKVAGSSPSSRTPTPTSSRNSSGSGRRASRFCHECGTRYPVTNAKFCCECGTRRMWIEA